MSLAGIEIRLTQFLSHFFQTTYARLLPNVTKKRRFTTTTAMHAADDTWPESKERSTCSHEVG